MSVGETELSSHSLLFIIFLVVTSLICGALVMTVEILGSRVIGPFFGASLFVWTSLITVTLVGLALGYAAGGILSDRRASPDYLYCIIFLAGIAVLLVPALKKPVMELTLPIGVRLGALSSSALLFGPALLLLGCVSPYIIKIAAREVRNIGRTVGLFYALSTVGSFVGTICTGFILIAWFPVNRIFAFIGMSLIVLAVLYFLLFRKKPFFLLLLAVPFILPGGEAIRTKVLDNGTAVTRLYDADTFYGNTKVLEYSYGDRRMRDLLVDSAVQGGMDPSSGMSMYSYTYYLQYIPYSINPRGKNCLVIGLGVGAVPTWYESMGIVTDVVDISPEVFAVAETYFGFRNHGGKFVEDARYFLSKSHNKYDYVILDVFNGENTPSHVLSLEALQLISRRMNSNGILAVNLINSLRKEARIAGSFIKTLRQVFSTVDIYPCDVPDSELNNVELFAYNFPHVQLDRDRLKSLPYHPMVAAKTRDQIGREFTLPSDAQGIILTDDYNPVDSWDLRLKEALRTLELSYTDKDMLL
ncbi:MAG: fused MFS/spermidine synthase [Nitrospirae bacterium]|nr:fused MFS/spermidine synthase [Nitrospirota bacterium]